MVVRQRLTSRFLNDVFGVEKIAQHFLRRPNPAETRSEGRNTWTVAEVVL